MKKALLSFSLLATTVSFGQNRNYPIQAVNFTQVRFLDKVWGTK